MLNTTSRFLFALFDIFLVWICLANFLGWSGGALSVTGVTDVDWENSYVGFQSIFDAVSSFDDWLNYAQINGKPIFNMSAFADNLSKLTDVILFGIPKLITLILNGKFDFLALGKFLFTFFGQPILLLAYSSICLGTFIYWILGIIGIFLKFCGGAYNVPYTDTTDVWSQYDYTSNWDWTSLTSRFIGQWQI